MIDGSPHSLVDEGAKGRCVGGDGDTRWVDGFITSSGLGFGELLDVESGVCEIKQTCGCKVIDPMAAFSS